jgi:uncharacterized protein with HEPN domain
MNKQRVRETLDELLDEIERVQSFIYEISFDAYSADWKARRATERAVSIISEASRRIPEEFYEIAPEVPWRKIRGIGNVLRHEYDDVMDEVIYAIATEELGVLKTALIAIAAALDEPEE